MVRINVGPLSRTLATTQSIVAELLSSSSSGNQCYCPSHHVHSAPAVVHFNYHVHSTWSARPKQLTVFCDTTHGPSPSHSDHPQMFVGRRQMPLSAAVGPIRNGNPNHAGTAALACQVSSATPLFDDVRRSRSLTPPTTDNYMSLAC